MHVTVNRAALLEVLGAATGVVASRTTKDILRSVRLTAGPDALLLSATDLEVALRVRISQVQIKKKGDVLIPADKLTQICRESIDDTLVLEAEDRPVTFAARTATSRSSARIRANFRQCPTSRTSRMCGSRPRCCWA